MSRPSIRTARLATWIAIPAALIASGIGISAASYSAFSATTINPTSNWTSGTVALTDDDANSALFTATALKPGSAGEKCIAVTSTGSLPSVVKLYATSGTAATTNAFSSSINLTITQGTGATFAGGCGSFTPLGTGSAVYSGTLAGFGTASTSFANGLGAWTTTGAASETRVYRFAYDVAASAPNTTQGSTAALGFTWEAQNN